MIFTIAIPFYNDQNSIEKCLNSILNQTIGQDSLDIICVNDGSTDNTASILDEYARNYECIRVLHQENSGSPSRPRNRAIEEAKGEFIYFVDGDDYIGEETLERMYEKIKQYNSDIVVGKYVGVNRGVPKAIFRRNPDNFSFYGSNAMFAVNALKLFRVSMVRKYNLSFPEHLSYGEDISFTVRAFAYSNSISIVKDYDCYYLTNHQTVGRVQLTKKPKSGKLFIDFIKEVLMEIDQLQLPEEKKDIVFFQYWDRLVRQELDMLQSRSLMYHDKIYFFDALKDLLAKYGYKRFYHLFSDRSKLLLKLLEEGEIEDVLAFKYTEESVGGTLISDGKQYPASDLAFAISKRETLRLPVKNNFEALVTSAEQLENGLLVQGYTFHTHLSADEEVRYMEFRSRTEEKSVSLPLNDGMYNIHYPITSRPEHANKYELNPFHLFIPVSFLYHFNHHDATLDLHVSSNTGGINHQARVNGEIMDKTKTTLILNKEKREHVRCEAYSTKWGNFSIKYNYYVKKKKPAPKLSTQQKIKRKIRQALG